MTGYFRSTRKSLADDRAGASAPPRVSIVSHTYAVAANRGKVAALAEHEGITIQLIVPSVWWNPKPARPLQAEPQAGDAYELRILSIRALRPALHWYTSGALRRALVEFVPGLVHVEEEPWSLAALQVALLKRRLGFKLSLFTWENLDRTLPWTARLVQRLVLRRVDHLIAGNAEAAAVMRARGYDGPVEVLPQHGVDLECRDSPPVDEAGRERLALRGFVVGYVGRLVPEKGIDVLLDAFAQLGADACLLVVGEGPLRGEIQRRAAALGVDDRVIVAAGVPHDAVPGYLRLMDVLVLPSRTTPNWKEQFGHVLIEAMASGVAVAGSDSGEIPHVIGDAGMIFPDGDVQALTTCLRTVRDPTTRSRLARLGRSRARDRYTNVALAGDYARVFRTTLGCAAR